MDTTSDHTDRIYELIAKELEGSISKEEKEKLETWCSFSSENKVEYQQVIKVWSASKLNEVNKGLPLFDEHEAWTKINLKISKPKDPEIISPYRYWKWAVAASILILFGVYSLLTRKNYEVNFVAMEQNVSKILPDNSTVTLDSLASISYSNNFSGNKRELILRGNGFFDVTKNDEKPFLVHTRYVDISVLGTSFYIQQDSSKNLVIVKVISGTVSVKPTYKAHENVLLSVGESVFYDITLQKFTKNIVEDNEFYWHTKTLMFDQMRLAEVINILNTKFHTNIVLGRSSLGACRLTTSFEHQTLEEILRIISMTLNLTVEYNHDEIKLSGDGC